MDRKPVTEWTQQDVEKILQGIDLKEEAQQIERRRLDALAETAACETKAVMELARQAELLQAQAEVASIASLCNPAARGRRRRRRQQSAGSAEPPESQASAAPVPDKEETAIIAAAELEHIARDCAATLRRRDALLGPEAKNENPAVLGRGDVPLAASRQVASSVRGLLSRLQKYEVRDSNKPGAAKASSGQVEGKAGEEAMTDGAGSVVLLGSSAKRQGHPRGTDVPQALRVPPPVTAAAALVGDVLRRCARQATRCAGERALALGSHRASCEHFRTLLAQAHAGDDASVWVRRGLGFLGMGALCLAEMHADRAVELSGERPEHVAVEAPALEGRVLEEVGGGVTSGALDVLRWEVPEEQEEAGSGGLADGGDGGAVWNVRKGAWKGLDPGAGPDLIAAGGVTSGGVETSDRWWSDPIAFKRGVVRAIDLTAGWGVEEWMLWQRRRWGAVLRADMRAEEDDRGKRVGEPGADGAGSASGGGEPAAKEEASGCRDEPDCDGGLDCDDLFRVARLLRQEGNVLFDEGFNFVAGVKFRSAAAALLLSRGVGAAAALEAGAGGSGNPGRVVEARGAGGSSVGGQGSGSGLGPGTSWAEAVAADADLMKDLGLGGAEVTAAGFGEGAGRGLVKEVGSDECRLQLAMSLLNSASCMVRMEDARQAVCGERAAAGALRAVRGMLGGRGRDAVDACLEAGAGAGTVASPELAKCATEPAVEGGAEADPKGADDGTGAAAVGGVGLSKPDDDSAAGAPQATDSRAADLAVRAAIRLARSRGMRGRYSEGHRTAKAAAALVAAAAEAAAGRGEAGWGPDRGRKWAREAYAEGRRWAFARRDAGGDVVEA